MSRSAAGSLGALLSKPSFGMVFGGSVIVATILCAIFAPVFLGYGDGIVTSQAMRPPSVEHWFGTDNLGRDIFIRTLSGARNSVLVGIGVALVTLLIGTIIGLLAGYFQRLDGPFMRLMDGFMAIPGVLLAIALASLLGNGLATVIIAITVPEIPRTARLIRSVVMSIRVMPFVAAAVSVGSATPKILFRHILPNAMPSLMVQATFVCASAILTEAVLSFLGVGTSPDIPSWGNVMAGGRQFFRLAPWVIIFPGIFLSVLVLAINLFGDALRDKADPRLAGRRA